MLCGYLPFDGDDDAENNNTKLFQNILECEPELPDFLSDISKDLIMFSKCEKIRILDLSFFDTKNVKDSTNKIFEGCNNLKIIIINKKDKLIEKVNKNKIKIIDLKLTLAYKLL